MRDFYIKTLGNHHCGDCPDILIDIIYKRLITSVLLPGWIQVQDILVDWENTTGLVETSCWEVLVVWEVLVLEMTETDHIVTTPVLIEELTTTLVVNLLE